MFPNTIGLFIVTRKTNNIPVPVTIATVGTKKPHPRDVSRIREHEMPEEEEKKRAPIIRFDTRTSLDKELRRSALCRRALVLRGRSYMKPSQHE
ncbi:hypothetical protein CDAR_252461 [Caerostris darwini]|uniref:Uncharacterized protein n=1 Tax=Caerostris darwini TaxID=1538125 RepID=A0AAV4WJ15_9ARAC|nr:hypothetical protein CDAR_252461 [Caerostris darwini]